MHHYTAVIERCADTDVYVGYIPGLPGAHSQAATLDELHDNLVEVLKMLKKTQRTPQKDIDLARTRFKEI